MKANLPKTVRKKNGKGPYHGYELQLTIGMIVKNGENTLDRCLSSLMPLLHAIPSELIVTDTGSTDASVEIAKKYTNRIQHFEWCGDFSAARNAALKVARGEWFMFIDADEWFEDITEIINFFQSGEYSRYGCASYIVRDYSDLNGNSHSDFHAARLFHCYPGIKFEGIVHEGIAHLNPVKIFDCFVHHYGYCYANREKKLKKSKRNTGLLEKELKINPNNLKAYYQLTNQYMVNKEIDKAIEICERGLELLKKHPNRIWKLSLQNSLLKIYLLKKDSQKILDVLEEFHLEREKPEIFFLDYYYNAQAAAFSLEKYSQAVQMGKSYLSVYKEYHEGKLDTEVLIYGDFQHIEKKDQNDVLFLQGKSYILLDNRENALSCLDSLDISLINGSSNIYSLSLFLSSHFHDWSICAGFYRRVVKLQDKEKMKNWTEYLEKYFHQYPEDLPAAMEELSQIKDGSSYILLCRLRCAENKNDRETARQYLNQLIKRADEWNSSLSDALYYAIREQADLQPAVEKLPGDELAACISIMARDHADLVNLIPAYFQSHSLSGVRGLFWTVSLKEAAVLLFGREKQAKKKDLLFIENFARQLSQYVHTIYREEILEQNLSNLPNVHRFGYYMGEAFAAEGRCDSVEYLAGLRKALDSYPIMKEPIRKLMEQLKQEEKQEEKKKDEFSTLARQAKRQIEQMLAEGQKVQAMGVIEQLDKLLPGDKEIERYRRLASAT